ncbi:MAG: methyltransferase domain-containing protein [Thermoanaerobaculia bacterium]
MKDQTGRTGEDPSVEAQKGYWDHRWNSQRSPNAWQTRRAETILALLRPLSLDSPRILDLGCATGWMAKRLAEIGTVEGVDLSDTAIAMARSQFPEIQFTAGDLYEISLTAEPVDVVVCQEVIAHVSDPPGLIERIDNVLKPGGYLVITAANKFVMDRVRFSDGIVGVGPEDPDEHIKKWLGMRDLKLLLRPYFKILHTTSIIPMGNHGVLRVINSHKVNNLLTCFLTPRRLEAFKERMGFGYSIIVMGQKPS